MQLVSTKIKQPAGSREAPCIRDRSENLVENAGSKYNCEDCET